MKKLFIFLTILLASFTLVACGTTGNEKTPAGDPVQLAAPQVSVDDNGLASWTAVENAVGYIYKLNGKEQATMKT